MKLLRTFNIYIFFNLFKQYALILILIQVVKNWLLFVYFKMQLKPYIFVILNSSSCFFKPNNHLFLTKIF